MKLLSLAATAVLATASSAQSVHVVDGANGPGTDFVNLAAAINAAADGDLLLIRDGNYSANQTIDGKGLTLQAEAGAAVTLAQVVIKNIGLNQVVALRGISWDTLSGPVLELSDNQGPIWIESGSNAMPFFGLDAGCVLTIKSCDNVVLRDLTFDPGLFINGSTTGACVSVEDSRVALYGCDLTGAAISGKGATGLRVSDSQVTLHGGSVTGGEGKFFFPSSGEGGTGMIVTGTLGTTTVDRIAAVIQGGAGEPASGSTNPGPSGLAIVSQGTGGVVTQFPQGRHLFSAPSPLRSGEGLTITFTGNPSDRIFVLASSTPAPLSNVAGVIGPLVLSPSSQLLGFGMLGSTSMGGRNTVNLGFVAPTVLTDVQSFYLQGLFLGTAQNPHVSLGTPTQVHVLNAAF